MASSQVGKISRQDLITSCYQSVWDPSLWSNTLERLRSYCGASATTLECFGQDRNSLVDFHSARIDTDSVGKYLHYYEAINPRNCKIKRSAPGDSLYDRAVLSEKEIDRDEFYTDLLMPYGLRYFLSNTLISDGAQLVLLAQHRSISQGHVDKGDVELLSEIAPFFAQAYQMGLDIGRLEQSNQLYEQILNTIDNGLALLDSQGKLQFINQAAEKLVGRSGAVSLARNCIAFTDAALQTQFCSALQTALEAELQHPPAAIIVPGTGSTPCLHIRIAPVRARGFLKEQLGVHKNQRRALVIIRDVFESDALPDSALMYCFALTRRECELARAIVSGHSLARFAEIKQTKITTVRTQFVSLRAKLGARNKSDVLRLLIPLLGVNPQ